LGLIDVSSRDGAAGQQVLGLGANKGFLMTAGIAF
jgi:hypothetical protein